MNKFEDLLQSYLNKDYYELVSMARRDFVLLQPICKAFNEEDNGRYLLASVLLSAIGADGTLTPTERRFLKDVMRVDDATVTELIKLYNKEMPDLTKLLAEKLPAGVIRNNLLDFA